MLVPGAGEQPSAVYPGLLGTIKEGDLAGMAGQLLCPEQLWRQSFPRKYGNEGNRAGITAQAEMLKPGWGNPGPFAICWMFSLLIRIFSQR